MVKQAQEQGGGITAEINMNPEGTATIKPRSKSFEVSIRVMGEDSKRGRQRGDPILVWSGLKLGPPRALKFPSDDVIVANVVEALSSRGLLPATTSVAAPAAGAGVASTSTEQ